LIPFSRSAGSFHFFDLNLHCFDLRSLKKVECCYPNDQYHCRINELTDKAPVNVPYFELKLPYL